MRRIFCAFILCHLMLQPAVAQLDTLVKKFDKHRRQSLQEKIYVHLDRNFLLTGETLWFKIYTVDGSLHRPLDLSKVAYVEILDRSNFPVLQAKIKMDKGVGDGSLFIPASLSSGHYRFRAYTSWMQNTGPEFFYDEVISIANPFVAAVPVTVSKTTTYSLDFFPEGGNLVSGVPTTVAFKVADESGNGVFPKGYVIDDRGDTAAVLSPGKFGLGKFQMRPDHERRYRAFLADGSGGKKPYTFPEVYTHGYTMRLLDSADVVKVYLVSKGVNADNAFLFVHARQIITKAERISLVNGHAQVNLKKRDLAAGISHFTLFNDALQPVCERLYFTYRHNVLDIAVETNQKIFGTRKKVAVTLEAKSQADRKPGQAKLSMSVFKVDSLGSTAGANILPYLWLRSDLTGTIENPAYYFQNTQPGVAAAMDNLMLTHGWRRFDWQDVLGETPRVKHLPEVRDHIISATLGGNESISRGVFTYLGSPGKIIRAYGAWSDAQGTVRFEIKDFYGPRRIILQTKSDTSENYNLAIINPFSADVSARKTPLFRQPEKQEKELLSRSVAMQVQDIFHYETAGNLIEPPLVDSTAFYGKADATYFLDDYTRFPVMEEVMREYVPGVFVRKRKDGFHFLVVDDANKGILAGDPMVLLDGVPILDVDQIMGMDPLRVKKLEVVKRTYYLGQAMFSGIVSYTTYQGDLGGMELDPRSISLNYEGLQLKRRFHKPEYGRDQVNSRMPDQRYLLHWEPQIETDDEGKYQLEFYTSDVPGTYMIVVEGLDDQGNAGTGTSVFSVNAPDNQ